ncbi:MAG: hypothetical protein GF334_05390 [Candidatus Altiarchaeales archaeon]|nr:hypothetical protein [Candidatus Altiarchaeales archaeon]
MVRKGVDMKRRKRYGPSALTLIARMETLSRIREGTCVGIEVDDLDTSWIDKEKFPTHRCQRQVYTFKRGKRSLYPYIKKGHLCIACLRVLEGSFLNTLPDEELPAWMGHRWLFRRVWNDYLRRLEKVLGVRNNSMGNALSL